MLYVQYIKVLYYKPKFYNAGLTQIHIYITVKWLEITFAVQNRKVLHGT